MATEQITDDELLALRVLANTRGGVKLGSSVLLRLLNTVAALRAQLAERCVVGPDEVAVKREEWAALGQIVTLVNKHINDPCYLRNQLVPIVDRVSALRSGEAGKDAIYCGEHTAAEIPTILAAHPGYTLPSSHDF